MKAGTATVLMLLAPIAILSLDNAPALAGEGGRAATAATTPQPSAPTVDSEATTAISPFDAQLQARITPQNEATEWHFEYAARATGETLEGPVSVGSGAMSGNLEEQLAGPVDIGGGLKPATTYYFRVVASNAAGTTDGVVSSFQTPALQKPMIEGESQSGITQTTAMLSGTVNPLFQLPTACEFQYVVEATFSRTGFAGTPSSVGCTPAAAELGSSDEGVGVSAKVEGLKPNTTYYYRLIAENGNGTGEGAAQTFLTLPPAPTVTTGEAQPLPANGALIAGEVDPGSSGPNSDTTYWFEYGTDLSYSNRIPEFGVGEAGQGETPVKESAALVGLEPETTYHYRIVASNDNASASGGAPQVVYGEGKEFTTVATPPILGEIAVASVGQSTVNITASLDARSLPTRYELRIGTEPSALQYGASGDTSSAGAETIALEVGSLTPSAVYYLRLFATNPDGTVQSGEASFTTLSAPPVQTLALASFPQTPPLASLVPTGVFGHQAPGTIAPATTRPVRCAKNKKLEHGRCIKGKAKRKTKARNRKRGKL